ncbi:MAG: flavodoxin domain-containing protein, partial [Bdellovibrionota bacterium]
MRISKVLIIYGTTDGHTRKIANRLGSAIRDEGVLADVVNAREATPEHRPENYGATIVAASVHMQDYQRAVKRWVRHYAEALNRQPSAFISVCLAVLEENPKTQAELKKILGVFLRKNGWKPTRTQIVAGAIPYTRYGLIKKWVMRRIAIKAGGGTDTSQDYE